MIRLFLSASVPLPERDNKYLSSVDGLAIRDSLKALVTTFLNEGLIIFGGHPAITPMLALLLRTMPADTKRRLVLYQSRFFEKDFLDEKDEFVDLRLTPAESDRTASLRRMRHDMIRAEPFDAAVFIGGMEGIWEEYHEFLAVHPDAPCFPIASTGAAALELYQEIGAGRRDLIHELTYPTLFRSLLKEIQLHKRE